MGYEWDIPIKGGWVTCSSGSCEKKTCWLNTKKTYVLVHLHVCPSNHRYIISYPDHILIFQLFSTM